jgi:predicted RNA binding protein YcfA (HicA-like mRNA interferase family)
MFGNEESQSAQKAVVGFKNISFSDATACAEAFGFRLDRINGSHRIFVHPEFPNWQIYKTSKEKPSRIRLDDFYNWLNDTIFKWTANDERLSR